MYNIWINIFLLCMFFYIERNINNESKKKYVLVCYLYFNIYVLKVFECFKIIRNKRNIYVRYF